MKTDEAKYYHKIDAVVVGAIAMGGPVGLF